MTRLESQAALHRFDVMLGRDRSVALGRKRPLPAAAWRHIALRLDRCAQMVPSAYRSKYAGRATEAWARWNRAVSTGRVELHTYDCRGRVTGVRWVEAR